MLRKMAFALLLLVPAVPAPAQAWLPPAVESALGRIEQALRRGSPESIEDLVPSRITMRLGDSLYRDASSIQAMRVLKEFFADKRILSVQFGAPGSGLMTYEAGGTKDTTHVDVWLARSPEGLVIQALNISNYPVATVFFDRRRETGASR